MLALMHLAGKDAPLLADTLSGADYSQREEVLCAR